MEAEHSRMYLLARVIDRGCQWLLPWTEVRLTTFPPRPSRAGWEGQGDRAATDHHSEAKASKGWSTERGGPTAELSQETHQGYRCVTDGSERELCYHGCSDFLARSLLRSRRPPICSTILKHNGWNVHHRIWLSHTFPNNKHLSGQSPTPSEVLQKIEHNFSLTW